MDVSDKTTVIIKDYLKGNIARWALVARTAKRHPNEWIYARAYRRQPHNGGAKATRDAAKINGVETVGSVFRAEDFLDGRFEAETEGVVTSGRPTADSEPLGDTVYLRVRFVPA